MSTTIASGAQAEHGH